MDLQLWDLGIHPKYSFIHFFFFHPIGPFPIELLRFLWHFNHCYYVAIKIHIGFFFKNLKKVGILPYSLIINRLLLWFKSPSNWIISLEKELKDYLKTVEHRVIHAYSIIVFHRLYHLSENGQHIISYPQYSFYKTYPFFLMNHPHDFTQEFRLFQKKKKILPKE